ncbi:two-component system, chemotaxis family, response regulator CheB [Hymenobacter daecheongensis DSM 21074]|uniref:protein-glutamate methylesterase n=1 Tax=Hymenobacter daecheongensis DSM 21074 TaxID=1121955 RepID=A0A1M6ECP4_9BACT|nr:two-component system, chemotaxis family, response regulator CheB [Hymenobacter daecheongensis DSM 21074]
MPTLVRMQLTKLLHAEPDLRVVGSAAGPDELVAQARRLRPGLVIAAENQLLGLERLARQQPVPVLLYSSAAPLAGMLREAARWGVFDYIRPLLSHEHPGFNQYRNELLRKIRSVRLPVVAPTVARTPTLPMPPSRVVVLGGSTGGTTAVESLLRSWRPSPNTTIIVAVHLPAHFTNSFVERLRKVSGLPVVAGWPGTTLEAGTIIVAPGGQNTVIRPVTRGAWLTWQTDVALEASPTPDEPSIDLLMRSAVRAFGRATTGVILTGLGTDGTLGAQSIWQAGGVVVAQDEASAAVFSMPKSVIQAGYATTVLPLAAMPEYLSRVVLPGRPAWVGPVTASPKFVAR